MSVVEPISERELASVGSRSDAAEFLRPLSVVVPTYRTGQFAAELLVQLNAVCPKGTEVIFVDDCCPLNSGRDVLLADPGELSVSVFTLSRNVGQHAAALVGLANIASDVAIVMDGDLQDSPHAIALLLARLRSDHELGAVCAARDGNYESIGRQRSAKLYRHAIHLASRRRVPKSAAMFTAVREPCVRRVLGLNDPFVPLVPALGRLHVEIGELPTVRTHRADGESAYRSGVRLRVGARGLVTVSALYPFLRWKHRRRWEKLNPQITANLSRQQ